MIKMQRKVQTTIILDLELLLEQWMDTAKESVLPTFDIYEKIRGYGLPALCAASVARWLQRHHDEMKAALEKTDLDLAEGYRYLDSKQLKARIEALSKMLADLSKFKISAKAARAPREKKLPSATKLIERLKYLKQDNDHKITSINPVRLIGAHRLITFDVRNRCIFDYRSNSSKGFSLSGSKLLNVDEAKMRYKKLRKPERDLAAFITSSDKAIEKLWLELTTTEGKPNNRINEHMVLLRVYEEPST